MAHNKLCLKIRHKNLIETPPNNFYSHQMNAEDSVVFIEFYSSEAKEVFVKSIRNYQRKQSTFWHVKPIQGEKPKDKQIRVQAAEDVYSKLEKSPMYAAMACIYEHERQQGGTRNINMPLSPVDETFQCWLQDERK